MFRLAGNLRAPGKRGRAAILVLVLLSACTSAQPVAYTGLASSSRLRPAPQGAPAKVPFVYAAGVNWRRYYKVILDPVEIYTGPDRQFGKIPREGQAELADYMQAQFHDKLGEAFEMVEKPGANTLRIHLTLTGAAPTKPVLATFSRFDIAGGPYNAFQGARGKEGTLTGSVIYSVEIYDARDRELILAQITKQFPNALNIGASIGALSAAKAGIRKGADDLVEQLTRVSPRK